MNEPITILIVDDHQLVRQGVRDFLETQSDLMVVGEASNGDESVRLASQYVPDVILILLVVLTGNELLKKDSQRMMRSL